MGMFTQVRLSTLKRAGPIAAALVFALVLVPAASSGAYTDASGDGTTAGDIVSVTVTGDKTSGQLLFRITGANIASSQTSPLLLDIDSDANPLTGDLRDNGSDYSFFVDNNSYFLAHWDGANWVETPDLSVQVSGNTSQILISVNRSEVGNPTVFNFFALSFDSVNLGFDSAPDQGAYNYSFDANGPQIIAVAVLATPAAPKAGKRFVIAPAGLKLPPDGQTPPPTVVPDSYSCTAKLGARKLAGSGTGRCTFAIPKKNAKGKRLTVVLKVSYQGATKVVPFTFKVR
jgi:hypothetical protein